MFIYASVCLCICLYVCLSVCLLSSYLFLNLFVCLSVCLAVFGAPRHSETLLSAGVSLHAIREVQPAAEEENY